MTARVVLAHNVGTNATNPGTPMQTTQSPKKASENWHRADIVAALRKADWSLNQLSKHHGYAQGSLGQALDRPYPKAERLIAEAIGTDPEVIWPERYYPDGSRRRASRALRPAKTTIAPQGPARNAQKAAA